MQILSYVLVSGISPDSLSTAVSNLDGNYTVHGSPFFADGFYHQAVVNYADNSLSEYEERALELLNVHLFKLRNPD